MSSDTTEKALEACIERFFTGGISVESRGSDESPEHRSQEDPPDYKRGKGIGYLRGKSSDYNAEFAIDEAKFWQFLEATQADELVKLHYKPDWKRQILERLHRKLNKDGILAILKKGLDVDNAHFLPDFDPLLSRRATRVEGGQCAVPGHGRIFRQKDGRRD